MLKSLTDAPPPDTDPMAEPEGAYKTSLGLRTRRSATSLYVFDSDFAGLWNQEDEQDHGSWVGNFMGVLLHMIVTLRMRGRVKGVVLLHTVTYG
jgi:hypothetical protein